MKKRTLLPALAGVTLVTGLAFGLVGPSSIASAAPAANTQAPIEEVATATAPTWQEFKSSAYVDGQGTYIVDGDIPLHGEAALREHYDHMVGHLTGTLKDDHDHGEHTDLVIKKKLDGEHDKWDANTIGNLTYCVSDEFGANKQAVIDSMEDGASPWEDASSEIDFRYESRYDSDCVSTNPNVVFAVVPWVGESGKVLARAFFPSYQKSKRDIWVAPSAFTTSWTMEAVMAHELGHVLGFRHEHVVPEAGVWGTKGCTETSDWEQVTPYDSVSIMHYPHCNGDSEGLSFSYYDRVGTRMVYGW